METANAVFGSRLVFYENWCSYVHVVSPNDQYQQKVAYMIWHWSVGSHQTKNKLNSGECNLGEAKVLTWEH